MRVRRRHIPAFTVIVPIEDLVRWAKARRMIPQDWRVTPGPPDWMPDAYSACCEDAERQLRIRGIDLDIEGDFR